MRNASREHDRTVRLKAKDQSPHSRASPPKAIARKHFASIVRPRCRVGNLLCHGDLPHYLEDLSELLRSERHRHNNEMKVVAKIAPLPCETFSVT